jgi:hypothetical protein
MLSRKRFERFRWVSLVAVAQGVSRKPFNRDVPPFGTTICHYGHLPTEVAEIAMRHLWTRNEHAAWRRGSRAIFLKRLNGI